jgi:hypothetical protein
MLRVQHIDFPPQISLHIVAKKVLKKSQKILAKFAIDSQKTFPFFLHLCYTYVNELLFILNAKIFQAGGN